MVPFINLPPLQIGPLSIHAFGTAVAIAVLVGMSMSRYRAIRVGLDTVLAEKMFSWLLIGGLVGAHLFAVLFYFPGTVRTDPWVLLRFWQHLSSFGGMLGGLTALSIFLWLKHRHLSSRQRGEVFNHVAFVFPFSLAIGRMGCAMVHDHPGSLTKFPLAVSLESDAAQAFMASMYPSAMWPDLAGSLSEIGFHDLGLYEMLYLLLIIIPVFLWLDRKPKSTGHFVPAFVLLYMPVRFGLDFLRVSDAVYAGLTPAQWIALASLLVLPLYWIPKKNPSLSV